MLFINDDTKIGMSSWMVDKKKKKIPKGIF